jgi:accessory colonization factor AcfC
VFFIRAYVDAVKAAVASENTAISAEELLHWSKWALAEADRIDPVRSARFIRAFES